MKNRDKDNSWIFVAQSLYDINKKIQDMECQQKELIETLKDLSDDVPSYGGGFYYTPRTMKGLVDYSTIPQLKNIDLDRYRKPPRKNWYLTYDWDEIDPTT